MHNLPQGLRAEDRPGAALEEAPGDQGLQVRHLWESFCRTGRSEAVQAHWANLQE